MQASHRIANADEISNSQTGQTSDGSRFVVSHTIDLKLALYLFFS